MKVKNYLSFLSLLVLAFALYSSYYLHKLYFYETEILVDTKKSNDGLVSATTFFNNGTRTNLTPLADNQFTGEVLVKADTKSILKIKLDTSRGRILEAFIGERQIPQHKLISSSDLVGPNWGPDPYYNYQIIKTGADSERAPPYWLFIGIIIWALFLYFNKNENQSEGPLVLRDLVFSGSIFKFLSPKDYVILFIIYIFTAFITVGCDALPILNIILIFTSGVDVYQYQVGHKLLLNYEFINWPYNPFFLVAYSFFAKLPAKLLLNMAPVLGYQHFQMLGIKTLNYVLLLASSLSMVSYAIDAGYLKDKARTVFYLCFLNPVMLYVSVLFLQLDILPFYLVTLGLLSLTKKNINIFNSGLLLGLGLTCKLQNLLLLGPILLASFLVFIFSESELKLKTRLIKFVSHSGLILFILISLTKPFKSVNQAFYHLVSNFSQTDRLWMTVLTYAHDGLYIYITFFVLILLGLIHTSYFHSKLSKIEIITNIFFMMGMIILSFSFAHMNTPSTLIQAGSGLYLLLILRNDPFQRTFLFLGSILILFNVTFSDVGDVTRILGWNGSYFTELYRTMPHLTKVKYSSVLFTIANSTMLAYALLMLKESISRLKAK